MDHRSPRELGSCHEASKWWGWDSPACLTQLMLLATVGSVPISVTGLN